MTLLFSHDETPMLFACMHFHLAHYGDENDKVNLGYEDPGGHLNTSVVHMCDQRFSKHTLIEICPFEEKHP